ncbi:zinc finger protein GAI-ASSOCIATED FACTOR 1-like [Rutidosis leptorrhynchoides]|uniref:zinc finger protein GAI-ASSOCIATED FACTOR 1-like n=1 Tax=Rutidosis leptorrhynchoides TaxID=125765 RepID=UPI003A9A0708
MVNFENSSVMAVSTASVDETQCSSPLTAPSSDIQQQQPIKKKRNLPGMPDPDAEVIALSPTTLVATNRFVCEICNKGFQRDQNLQLHRRGHNLPWKLKQRDGKEIRKRVYVCPEKTCVHHDPSRALGDLTGIKKHFSRKHGEKKWKCERCSKKYAVQSDWKAHMKTCGTKEYRCDCGTLFSRRDSFITHRAFCDALAQESARSTQTQNINETEKVEAVVMLPSCSPPPPPLTPSTGVLSPVQSVHSSDLPEKATTSLAHQTGGSFGAVAEVEVVETNTASTTLSGGSTTSGNKNAITSSSGVYASIFASSTILPSSQSSPTCYSNMLCGVTGADRNLPIEPMSLSLSSSLYRSTATQPALFPQTDQTRYVQSQQPALSATALLQKAAQMGSTSSNTSFLHALGLAPPRPTDHYQETSIGHWNNNNIIQRKQERNENFNDHLLMGPPAPTTLDFLGLGMGGGGGAGGSTGGYSEFLSSTGVHVASAPFMRGLNSIQNTDWDDSFDEKPRLL